jgi:hypothetical protein
MTQALQQNCHFDDYGRAYVVDDAWDNSHWTLTRMILTPHGKIMGGGLASMAGWFPPECPVLKRAKHLDKTPDCHHPRPIAQYPDNGHGLGEACLKCGAVRYTYRSGDRGEHRRIAPAQQQEWHFDG